MTHPDVSPVLPLIIGVGSRARGDDAAGLEVVRRLRGGPPLACDVAETAGDAADLLALWEGRRHVVVVDALRGARAGRVHRLGADARLRSGLRTSSHGFGVADAVALAETLGRLPPRLEVIGIEGTTFAVGAPASVAVGAAALEVADRLRDRFGSPTAPHETTRLRSRPR